MYIFENGKVDYDITKNQPIVGYFDKVSYTQYLNDCKALGWVGKDEVIRKIYESIKLPERGTKGSAGYDFFAPYGFSLELGMNTVIPTGIRCGCNSDVFLNIVPRSGLGFKYKVELANTNGVIDSDYIDSDNQGHIMIKLVYTGLEPTMNMSDVIEGLDNDDENIIVELKSKNNISNSKITINAGDKFVQGIFINYGIAIGDTANKVRNGGFGSTGK